MDETTGLGPFAYLRQLTGGEEEKGVLINLPEDRQTAETVLRFLQLIMWRLHKRPSPSGYPARATVVVPNGTPYSFGVAARIHENLIADFNLHTVVRLPKGVFEPCADILPTFYFLIHHEEPRKSGSISAPCHQTATHSSHRVTANCRRSSSKNLHP